VCPYTFVRTRLRLEDMPLGARLVILVDHEPAARNVPRSAREWGQEIEAVEAITNIGTVDAADAADAAGPPGAGVWKIVLRKRVP
jgi:tRNA 2-thiouridine synthesizing protein A